MDVYCDALEGSPSTEKKIATLILSFGIERIHLL